MGAPVRLLVGLVRPRRDARRRPRRGAQGRRLGAAAGVAARPRRWRRRVRRRRCPRSAPNNPQRKKPARCARARADRAQQGLSRRRAARRPRSVALIWAGGYMVGAAAPTAWPPASPPSGDRAHQALTPDRLLEHGARARRQRSRSIVGPVAAASAVRRARRRSRCRAAGRLVGAAQVQSRQAEPGQRPQAAACRRGPASTSLRDPARRRRSRLGLHAASSGRSSSRRRRSAGWRRPTRPARRGAVTLRCSSRRCSSS